MAKTAPMAKMVQRSMLFVPGDQPDKIAKALAGPADLVVVDLEDAVSPGRKSRARDVTVRALPGRGDRTVLVRVNPDVSGYFAEDVSCVLASGADGVVLPKYERVAQLTALRGLLAGSAPMVLVGLETALGVADARQLLAGKSITAAYFGAEDYIADLGGHRTRDGAEVLYARSEVCLAARLTGIAAIDQAVLDVRDDHRFRADAEAGRAIGYAGKICVHPGQVPLAHEIFSPSTEEVEHAWRVLAAGRAGVAVVDGQMVDEVHLRMAKQVLARAGIQRQAGSK